ncbi:hypothetical protein DFQ27_001337, partial [Actinomortierella ambigua]
MDFLLYPQPTPAPLILPRRVSIHHSRKNNHSSSVDGNGRGSPPGNGHHSSHHDSNNNHNGSPAADTQSSRSPLTHYFYFPTTLYPRPQHSQKQSSPQQQHQNAASGSGSGSGGADGSTTTGAAAVSASAGAAASSSSSSPSFDMTQEDYLSSINMQRKPPAIFTFGNERGTTRAEDLSGLMYNTPSLAAIRNQTYRRHSLDSSDRPYLRRSSVNNGVGLGTATVVAGGGFSELIRSLAESQEEEENKKNDLSSSSSASSQQSSPSSSSSSSRPSRVLWTTIPPRHALHMPIMKINPEIWRSESHNREIYRIMHEARQQQIMKRRNIKAVMDTVEDDEEEDRPKDSPAMTDVIVNIDLGGWHALEEQQK